MATIAMTIPAMSPPIAPCAAEMRVAANCGRFIFSCLLCQLSPALQKLALLGAYAVGVTGITAGRGRPSEGTDGSWRERHERVRTAPAGQRRLALRPSAAAGAGHVSAGAPRSPHP